MKIKQKKAINAFTTLSQMGKKITGKTAWDLYRLKQRLKEAVDFQSEEEMKLVEKYGGSVDEAGRIQIPDENREAFMKDFTELGELECEIDLEVTADLNNIRDINMAEIEALDGIVQFK